MKRHSLAALVVAAFFGLLVWLSANLHEIYQTTVDVPIVMENLPRGWALRTPVPRSLQLRLRGEGWQLATQLFGRDLTVHFPVVSSSLAPAAIATYGSRIVTTGEIARRVPLKPGVELLAVSPDSILFELDRFVEKRVPVVVDCGLTFREGYGQTGPIAIIPDSVTIGGAESVLRAIEGWRTARVVFPDLKTPLETNVPLSASDRYEITLSTNSVHVSINVQPFAEKVFNGLAVNIDGVPLQREVIFIPPRIEIVVRGGIRQLANLSHGDFRVGVLFSTILADTTGIVEPVITGPAGIQVVSKRPERLQYIVRKRL